MFNSKSEKSQPNIELSQPRVGLIFIFDYPAYDGGSSQTINISLLISVNLIFVSFNV
jgi:hypothetical protein